MINAPSVRPMMKGRGATSVELFRAVIPPACNTVRLARGTMGEEAITVALPESGLLTLPAIIVASAEGLAAGAGCGGVETGGETGRGIELDD